jgi:hypothetical protein
LCGFFALVLKLAKQVLWSLLLLPLQVLLLFLSAADAVDFSPLPLLSRHLQLLDAPAAAEAMLFPLPVPFRHSPLL